MINFALFGAGGVGAYHLAAIERLEKSGRARLVAVADPTAGRMPERKAELEGRGVRWHMDYRALLAAEPDVQAVAIATPIPFHYEMAKGCLEHGVFTNLEKPPAPLLRQLEGLIAADPAKRVSVGFQMIGSRCVQSLKAFIAEGRLGVLQEINTGGCWPRLDSYYSRASWAGKMTLGGQPVLDGPATNALAHLIHNIMYLAGEGSASFAVPVEVAGELYRARPIESYDVACLRGHFASGTRFSAAVTHATELALPFQMEVRGSQGWARLSEDGASLETSDGMKLDEPETTQQLLDRDYDRIANVIEGQQERFSTRLEDTRGYVGATNGMFVSSGTIYDIDAVHIRRWEKDGEGGFDVKDLHAAVLETIASGRLFSEQKLPWAVAAPRTVSLPGPELSELMADEYR